MPLTKTNKVPQYSSSATRRRLPKKLIVTCAVLLIAVSAIWSVAAYKQYQKNVAIAKERAQFAQAEKDTQSKDVQLTSIFKSPSLSIPIRACHLISPEAVMNAEKNYYCNTGYSVVYPVQSQVVARSLALRISKALNETNYNSTDPDLELNKHPPVQVGNDYFTSKSNLDCAIAYQYLEAATPILNQGLLPNNASVHTNSLLVDIVCTNKGKSVLAPYYPVT